MTPHQLNVFLSCTDRFDRIMENLPFDLRMGKMSQADLDLWLKKQERNEGAMHAVVRYFNLCSEEFFLQKSGFVTDEVWSLWQTQIRATLKIQLFKMKWEQLKDDYDSQEGFAEFMNGLLQG